MPVRMTAEQYLQAIAPKLYASESRGVFLDMARERTNACFYGDKYGQAVALMAAHIWFLIGDGTAGAGSGSGEAGSTGTITSKREGDLSVSYGSGASSSIQVGTGEADLTQTRYGLQLLALRRGCKPFIGVCVGAGHGCR